MSRRNDANPAEVVWNSFPTRCPGGGANGIHLWVFPN